MMKAYDLKLIDTYGNLVTDTVHAHGYEIKDGFVHFFSSPAGYSASFRIDTVMSIKEGYAVSGTSSGSIIPTQPPVVNYIDNQGRDIMPIGSDALDAFGYAMAVKNQPAVKEVRPHNETYDPELLRKLAAMSEGWDKFPQM